MLFCWVYLVGANGWAGPYPPAAGQPGSCAVDKDDPNIVSWADGWDPNSYQVGSGCIEQWQTPEKALGKATDDVYDIVCLGDGGQITLTFSGGIGDGPGNDLVVFENAVTDTFLELAYVEASSDGLNFFRFPNDSLTAEPVGPFGPVDPTNVDGLASKYRCGFGTGFDLEVLRGVSLQLDVNNVRYVRIIDIIGDGSYIDTSGDVIYDPHLTSGVAGAAGFDLDAIGVCNMRTADFDLNGRVDHLDLMIFAEAWLSEPNQEHWNKRCDISYPRNKIINLEDFAVLVGQWLEGTY